MNLPDLELEVAEALASFNPKTHCVVIRGELVGFSPPMESPSGIFNYWNSRMSDHKPYLKCKTLEQAIRVYLELIRH